MAYWPRELDDLLVAWINAHSARAPGAAGGSGGAEEESLEASGMAAAHGIASLRREASAGVGGTGQGGDGSGHLSSSDHVRRVVGAGVEIRPAEVRLTAKEGAYAFQLLTAVPLQALHLRVALLRLLNQRVQRALELVDFSSSGASYAAAAAGQGASGAAGSAVAAARAALAGAAGLPEETGACEGDDASWPAGAGEAASGCSGIATVGERPLSALLRAVNHLVFSELKHRLLEAAVQATWAGGGRPVQRASVSIDNARAMLSAESAVVVGGAGAGAGAGSAEGPSAAAAAGAAGSALLPALPPLRSVEAASSQAAFVQAFRQLSRMGEAAVRAVMRSPIDERGRLFHVKYVDEAGIDYGGVSRDAITGMVDDLFSPRLDLLLPCPNAQAAAVGIDAVNAGKYLPNPAYAARGGGGGAAAAVQQRVHPMFVFLGQFMGMSLRTKSLLAFEFPSLLWKRIVGQPLGLGDLWDVDTPTARLLRDVATWTWAPPAATASGASAAAAVTAAAPAAAAAAPPLPAVAPWFARSDSAGTTDSAGGAASLRRASSELSSLGLPGGAAAGSIDAEALSQGGDPAATAAALDASPAGAAFATAFPGLSFVTTTLDRRRVELAPGGAGIPLTLSNRGAWVSSMAQLHLTQYDPLVALIRRGFFSVVPARAVRLLTWQELEVAVSGHPTTEAEVMRAHTDYEGFRAGDHTIVLFWRVMESFSNEERSLFLRFMYGRSRMPAKKWPRRMKIVRKPGPDNQLPVSHTCFASVELSNFTSEERMRWALLTAIHFSGGILNA
jgi:hypothetical protein